MMYYGTIHLKQIMYYRIIYLKLMLLTNVKRKKEVEECCGGNFQIKQKYHGFMPIIYIV